MSYDRLDTTLASARVPSIARSRSRDGIAIVDWLVATSLSLWPRRSHPPNVPEHLRADLGLPPDYEARTFHDVTLKSTLRRRIDHE